MSEQRCRKTRLNPILTSKGVLQGNGKVLYGRVGVQSARSQTIGQNAWSSTVLPGDLVLLAKQRQLSKKNSSHRSIAGTPDAAGLALLSVASRF